MKLTILTLIISVLTSFNLFSQAFITTWKTDNPGSSGNQITIPTSGSGYNYSVDWGDGMSDTGVTGNITHTYASIGTYTVTIAGNFPRIYFNNTGDKEKILTVEQWGNIAWTSMNGAFYGCVNLTVPATDMPNLLLTTDMTSMFNGATTFNQPVEDWDVSNVTNMRFVFYNATAFNQPIEGWDVSNVTDMNGMFFGTTAFNQPLGNWDVSRVEKMSNMFGETAAFNQPIEGWDVSNVTTISSMFNNSSSFNQPLEGWDVSNVLFMNSVFKRTSVFNQPIEGWDVSSVVSMSDMFFSADAFNQPLGNWDVGKVELMDDMFFGATAFNQPIGGWDVSSVINMSSMFAGASPFNQPLGNWDVSKVTDMTGMLGTNSLSVKNYDTTLMGWSALSTLQNDVTLGANDLFFCHSINERQRLIDNFGWSIIGDTFDCLRLSKQSYSIDENSSNETVLGILEVPSQDNLTFIIRQGNTNDAFRVNQSTRELIVNKVTEIDFETSSFFSLLIEVTDGVSTHNEFIDVNVNDINEAPVVQKLLFTVSENPEEGIVIGNVNASDPENDDLTYNITAGNSGNAFLVSAVGDVIVNIPEAISTTEIPTFNLSLEVSDGELTATGEITIEVDRITSISEFIDQIQIYPNPAQESLFLDFGDWDLREFSLEVLDLTGHRFISQEGTNELKISKLSRGLYILRIISKEQIGVTKFLKK